MSTDDLSADRYYRSSGAVPLTATLITLGAGLLAAVVLSLPYAAADYYNPFLKLRFVVTLLFGGMVGALIRMIALGAGMRNRGFLLLIAAALSFATVYFSWVWFVVILDGWNFGAIILDVGAMWGLIQTIAENGIWEMRGQMIGERALYTCWTGEALLIGGSLMATAAKEMPPYCEECRKWTQRRAPVDLPPVDEGQLVADLEAGRYEALARPAPKSSTLKAEASEAEASEAEAPTVFHRYEVYSCPGCDELHFLSVSHVSVKQGKEGPEEKTRTFLKHLIVPPECLERLDEPVSSTPAP